MFAYYHITISRRFNILTRTLTFFLSFSVVYIYGQKAIHIDQKGAYLEISDHPSLNTPHMTIECWLKINALGDPAIGGVNKPK